MLVSFLIIGFSLYIGVINGTSECEKEFYTLTLILGIFLLVISVLGLVGSCCRITFFLWLYLALMFFLILGLFAFTVFTFIVTNNGAGKALSRRGYNEYRLGDYSNWVRKRVTNERDWQKVKSCLVQMKLGCCGPPITCGFTHKNAMYWIIPNSGPASSDRDCSTWSNNHDRLCYECESCKAGVLTILKKGWRKIAIINVIVLVAVIIVYAIGCCAIRNIKYEDG
ncbi:hypothetical protein AAC387_Pa09g0803 [Persea americana]